jgi:pyruvate kinase
VIEAGVDAASLLAREIGAALIVVLTESGRSALALSNRRPVAPIVALTRSEAVARLLSLCWGVTAAVIPDSGSSERVLVFGIEWAKSRGIVRPGQRAVLLRGNVADHPKTVGVLAGEVP